MLKLILPPVIILVASTMVMIILWRKVSLLVERENVIIGKAIINSDIQGSKIEQKKVMRDIVQKIIKFMRELFKRISQSIAKIFRFKNKAIFKGDLQYDKNGSDISLKKGETSQIHRHPKTQYFAEMKKSMNRGVKIDETKLSVMKTRVVPKKIVIENTNDSGIHLGKESIIKIQRPTITDEVTQPEFTQKNAYRYNEDLLIERISKNPRDVNAYEALGDYYMEKKNWEDAKGCYQQVLKLKPTNSRTRTKIKRLERVF